MAYGVLVSALMGQREKAMKIYSVIDDSETVLVTADELTALRLFRKIMERHDVTYGWVDTMEVQ
jgi:hypothetical protein